MTSRRSFEAVLHALSEELGQRRKLRSRNSGKRFRIKVLSTTSPRKRSARWHALRYRELIQSGQKRPMSHQSSFRGIPSSLTEDSRDEISNRPILMAKQFAPVTS